MSELTLNLRVGEIVSVEQEDSPGEFTRCLVSKVAPDGSHKFVLQDKYSNILGPEQLKDYMYRNDVNQSVLATVLGIADSTMHRYLKGSRTIPAWCFDKLGITLPSTEMGRARDEDKRARITAHLVELVNQLVKLDGKEG